MTAERTFKQIYNDLPKREKVDSPKEQWINRIAAVTKKSKQTVRMWLYGVQVPDALTQSIIAKELKTPETVLFPEK